ncbi:holocytochrome c synthase CYC3 SCDLUD_003363 [Saccharomycodes ludwigii]|uniref:holocytochrome c synthase CYC3 n=1 Tax=Saccharomycodes ludwigii TaxID=36035 RepID=UPI001E87F517|nr:hypothetical protein SCDLUD_003363 [Saccharomycodes ludwigii]KAH3900386.1 hypothetical protein SCDLUD_003363 [Saccharomycodes ludwigii]
MGWFWADATSTTNKKLNNNATAASIADNNISSCPVMHASNTTTTPTINNVNRVEGCPVLAHGSSVMDSSSALNPLNNIPAYLPDEKLPNQKLDLPKDRTLSSIPKNDGSLWEYPSPQQMYNAMVRKGKIDPITGEEIPEDAVESMVDIHNFLNEGCWKEVLHWENTYHPQPSDGKPIKLLKFTGRPNDLSPMARWQLFLSKLFPNSYSPFPPFDRHDWTVLRPDPTINAESASSDVPGYKKVRYVIDFYDGPDEEDGNPTFYVNCRPALDDFESCKDRFLEFTQPVLNKFFDNNSSDKK